jgi:glyoxylase-like metal-dependent hydrolase (beta-lactamase superfamily II)
MNKTTVLDTNWVGHPRSIAAALLESEDHRAIIDPGPESTLATLREQLRTHGLAIADLDAILLTHIHLDHAGASGALVRENPGLSVYVHASGARHLADPTKLLASATRLWGDELSILFGETLPVPPENLRILEGAQTLTLGDRKLDVVYTPGHASHHVSYFHPPNERAFVGDMAAVRIPPSDFVMPPTPPPDIDIELWEDSIERILDWQPQSLGLTHFGAIDEPEAHFDVVRERLREQGNLARELSSEQFEERIREQVSSRVDPETSDALLQAVPPEQQWWGLDRYWSKQSASG